MPRSMLHPSFMQSGQNSSTHQPEHLQPCKPQTSGTSVSVDSLSPTSYNPLLDFTELLLHDDPTPQADVQPDVVDVHYAQQQQSAVQWYTADADMHAQRPSAGSYIVVGADGIQRQEHTLSTSGEQGLQTEHSALPNVIRKISNDTTVE